MKISARNIPELMEGRGVAQLAERLRAIVGPPHRDAAFVLLAEGERLARVSAAAGTETTGQLWLDIGCTAKLLTATTFLNVFAGTAEILTHTVGQHLSTNSDGWLSAITVQQLLNHTHGINEPGAWQLPLTPEGMIDTRSMLSAVAREPLSAAGEMYSYSSIGPWLLAAIVESERRKPFLEILRETFPKLLPAGSEANTLCPATGVGITVDAEEFLRELVRATSHRENVGNAGPRLDAKFFIPHRGWHPAELGMTLGWKAYRNDWYGHQSLMPASRNVHIRVSPANGRGILVCSTGGYQGKILQAMFDESVFGFHPPPSGVMRVSAPCGTTDTRNLGVYERLDSCIVVRRNGTDLTIQATSKVKGTREGLPFVSGLKRLSGNIYSVNPPIPFMNMFFVEFLFDRNSATSHIWNTARVWRKVA